MRRMLGYLLRSAAAFASALAALLVAAVVAGLVASSTSAQAGPPLQPLPSESPLLLELPATADVVGTSLVSGLLGFGAGFGAGALVEIARCDPERRALPFFCNQPGRVPAAVVGAFAGAGLGAALGAIYGGGRSA